MHCTERSAALIFLYPRREGTRGRAASKARLEDLSRAGENRLEFRSFLAFFFFLALSVLNN